MPKYGTREAEVWFLNQTSTRFLIVRSGEGYYWSREGWYWPGDRDQYQCAPGPDNAALY